MLAFMLDFHLKSLWTMENFVGLGNGIHFIFKYDVKKVIPLLMTFFDRLNFTIQTMYL
jgi:hypothetical protein